MQTYEQFFHIEKLYIFNFRRHLVGRVHFRN
jgi:hypothetical protein